MSPTGRSRREMGAGLRGLALVLSVLPGVASAFTNTVADLSCSNGNTPLFTLTQPIWSTPGGYPAFTSGGVPANGTAITSPSPLSDVEAAMENHGADGSTRTSTVVGGATYICTWQDTKMTSSSAVKRECITTGGTSGGQMGQVQFVGTASLTKTCATITTCPVAGTVYGSGGASFTNLTVPKTVVRSSNGYCEIQGGGGVCMTIPGGTSPATYCPKWTYTGNQGSAPSTSQSESTDNCIGSGNTCAPVSESSQCGTVNGEYVCLGSSPAPGGCVTTAKGNVICTSDSTHPLVNPPAPGTSNDPGAPGTVKTPGVQLGAPSGGVLGGASSTVVNVWPNGQAPDGEGAQTGDPAGEDPTGEPCGTDTDCNVKINEDGTDAVGTDLPAQLEAADASAQADEAAAQSSTVASANALNPGEGWEFADLVPNLPENACMTFTVGYFNGEAKQFPPDFLCDAIEDKLKPVLAFFLYVLTAFALVTRTTASV